MRSCLTHDLRADRELIFAQQSQGYLALVDLDSYPTYVAKKPDYLDMLQHLCGQTETLTAAMWEVPDALLQIKVLMSYDHQVVEGLEREGHRLFSTGNIRSAGRLGMASHPRLVESARRHGSDLRRGRRTADALCARQLLVPPGVYSVSVFSGAPHHGRQEGERSVHAVHYAVVLRHYPHPAPRVAPVRLRNILTSLAAREFEEMAWMRKMPDFSPSV